MYSDGEIQLATILSLVEKCPAPLKEKCFEILLQGYVQRSLSSRAAALPPERAPVTGQTKTEENSPSQIPTELLSRFRTAAKRIGVSLDALEALFDFGVEPMGFHALSVPGDRNADKTRKVALLVSARSYLTNGTWVADWKEIKAQCVNQNCYDRGNFATFLKGGQSTLFKTVDVGVRVELGTQGVKEAEELLKALANGTE